MTPDNCKPDGQEYEIDQIIPNAFNANGLYAFPPGTLRIRGDAHKPQTRRFDFHVGPDSEILIAHIEKRYRAEYRANGDGAGGRVVFEDPFRSCELILVAEAGGLHVTGCYTSHGKGEWVRRFERECRERFPPVPVREGPPVEPRSGAKPDVWFAYKYACDQAGIKFTHAQLAKKLVLAEGTARNKYSHWKAEHADLDQKR